MKVKWTHACGDPNHYWGSVDGSTYDLVVILAPEPGATHYIMAGGSSREHPTISGHVSGKLTLEECQAKALEWYKLLQKEGLA